MADERRQPPKEPKERARPADAAGPVPRVLDPLERAPRGLRRFKIRCTNYGTSASRYVLARDEAEARAHFSQAAGVDDLYARAKKGRAKDAPAPDAPDLVVVELED